MGSIKDRNGMDLTEADDIKKRWKEYTEELYKKDLHVPDNHDGMITNLEPDILECEVKWALGSITTNKTSGGDGIPAELKDDAVKLLLSIFVSKFGKLGSGYRTGKVSFHSNFQKKNLLVKVKEESERADLKLNIKKTKIMASVVTQG